MQRGDDSEMPTTFAGERTQKDARPTSWEWKDVLTVCTYMRVHADVR